MSFEMRAPCESVFERFLSEAVERHDGRLPRIQFCFTQTSLAHARVETQCRLTLAHITLDC